MTSLPSDEWLLALISEKSPREWTTAELANLRHRAAASPEIRRALIDRLALEESLHVALHDPAIDVTALSRQVVSTRRRRNVRRVLMVVGCIAALVVAGVYSVGRRPPDVPDATVDAGPSITPPGKPHQPAVDIDGGREQPSPQVVAVEAPRPSAMAVPDDETPMPAAIAEVDSAVWNASLGDDAPVLTFEQSAFGTFGETVPGFVVADEFPASELKRWIAAVPGQPFQVTENQWRGKRFAGLEGIAKLLPPWREDAVLRLAPFDVGEFAIHFWNGPAGVSIRYYPHQRPRLLAAYAIRRDGGEPQPATYRLLTTDTGRLSRSNAGAMEIRCRDGQLVVTRGSTPLLVVPDVAAPLEIYFEGRTWLRTLAMYRGEPAELSEVPSPANRLGAGTIDTFDWVQSTDPAGSFETSPEQVTLSWSSPRPEGPRKIVWAGVRLPESLRNASGLCEAVFRIEGLTPGTGLYLGDENGRPVHTLFASENPVAGAPLLAYGWSNRDGGVPEPRWRHDANPVAELVPAAGPATWIRLVTGRGGLKTFVSADGIHWGAASREPQRNVRGPWGSLGIYAYADEHSRSIAVSQIAVRELPALASLASDELISDVPDFDAAANPRSADWLQWVVATRPAAVSLGDWLRACSVKTLREGASDAIIQTILDGVSNDAVASNQSVDATLAVLADVSLLRDDWSDRGRQSMEGYDQLARRIMLRNPDPHAASHELSAVLDAVLAAPLWVEQTQTALPPELVRQLSATAAWSGTSTSSASARQPARQAAFYLTPSHPDGDWTQEDERGLATLAAWAGDASAGDNSVARAGARFAWQHPLVTEPGREAQTIAAELDAAISVGAYDDAARLLSTIAELPDLVPAAQDGDRFVPPVGLTAEMAERHPELIAALSAEFGAEGLLHVNQSIAAGDADAVRLGAVRYYGTPAAAVARRWLGERDLATGRFAEAEGHFTAALSSADEQDRADLEARRRLAAALSGGVTDGETLSSPVQFGSQTLAPDAFERMVGELQKSHAAPDAVMVEKTAIPAPVAVTPQPRGRFEGDAGRSPGRAEFRRHDWAARQIGVTLDRGVAWLTNRFQVVAFNLGNRTPTWAAGLGNEQGETHSLPGVTFRPIVEGERMYVRRMLARGPELACLSTRERGKAIWRTESNWIFASDPVFSEGRLVAVTSASAARSGGPFTLMLTRLRPDDGNVLASLPLAVINGATDAKPSAQLVANEYGFFVASTGTLLRCDRAGNIVWLRRLPHLPSTADVDADLAAPSDPLIVDGRLYAVPPGSRAVICLDAGTGRQLWVRPLGTVERLADVAGGVLVVRTSDGLLGLDPADGATSWYFERANLLEGLICDATTVLVPARTMLENKLDGLSLLRIDAATGTLKSEQIVRVVRNDEIRCGPLFLHDGNVWGFIGEGWRDPNRTLVEFVPDESLPAVGPAANPGTLGHWLDAVQPQTQLNVATVLPGWTMIGSQPGRGATFHDEYRGEQWVMQTQTDGSHAARFVRRLNVAPGQKLVARVARDDDEGWALRLFVDGKAFASEPVNKQTAPDVWRTVTFDLSRLAGRDVMLALDQAPPSADSRRKTKAYWKQVAIE